MKINEPKLLKLEVGKYYRTYDGWKAKIVWKCYKQDILPETEQYYVVVHRPEKEDESAVIIHDYNGKAIPTFSVNEPPQYTAHHPADLKEIWK